MDHHQREKNQKQVIVQAKKAILEDKKLETKNENNMIALREKMQENIMDIRANANFICTCSMCQVQVDKYFAL